jgi:hypothetical protein
MVHTRDSYNEISGFSSLERPYFTLYPLYTMCRLLLYKGKQPIQLAHVCTFISLPFNFCDSLMPTITCYSFSPNRLILLSTSLLTHDCESIQDDQSTASTTLIFHTFHGYKLTYVAFFRRWFWSRLV